MGLSGYFPDGQDAGYVRAHWQRLIYGSDFPNLPYAWDRDLRALETAGLEPEQLRAVLGGNARRLLGL